MSEVAQRHQRARIQQIGQSRGLTCKCGSTRWRFQRVKPQITGAVARLDCERCGRSSKLHLSRHEANSVGVPSPKTSRRKLASVH
jgi:hypothetical protein